MEHFNNQIPKIKSWNPIHTKPASREIISALLNCVRSNSLERMYDFRICAQVLLRLILSLQDLRQNQSPEIVPACIVVQCLPHDNTVCIHSYDECKRSNVLNVCRMLSSISLWHEQACSRTIKMSGLARRAKYRHVKTMCAQTFDNSPTNPISSCFS